MTFSKNGINGTQCPLTPVAGDKSLQVGIGLAKAGGEYYISVAIRFKETAQSVTNYLNLTLTDGTMVELPLYQAKQGYAGNSSIGGGNYKLNEDGLVLLSKKPIRTITFYLEDNLKHILIVEMNSKIIMNQIKCI